MEEENCRERNLCNTCEWGFAECCATMDDMEFGDGTGTDNVINCKQYSSTEE